MKTAVVGHVEWVTFTRVDRVPSVGEIVHASESWDLPAGGGAGAAVQMMKLASGTAFFTAVGDDDLGTRAIDQLNAMGVTVHAVRRAEPTRRAFTHIDSNGERTITVIGERLEPRGEDPLPWVALSDTDGAYFTAGDADALRNARRARVLVATPRAGDVLRTAAVQLDALVASARDPSESYRSGDITPTPYLVVRTEGEQGGSIEHPDGKLDRFGAAPLPGPAIDRYGAGDGFAGCLTYALARGTHPSKPRRSRPDVAQR